MKMQILLLKDLFLLKQENIETAGYSLGGHVYWTRHPKSVETFSTFHSFCDMSAKQKGIVMY